MSAFSSASKTAGYLTRRRNQIYDRMIRVNLAGELGADRIYWGQMAVLRKNPEVAPVIQHMWDQEKDHLHRFEYLALKHRASRSLLTPAWSVGGFLLGAGSALLGPRAAMACTVAVEKVITEHYEQQIRELVADDPKIHQELIGDLSKMRDDEQQHHDTGLEHEAEKAPAYKALSFIIENTCRIAIKMAEKV